MEFQSPDCEVNWLNYKIRTAQWMGNGTIDIQYNLLRATMPWTFRGHVYVPRRDLRGGRVGLSARPFLGVYFVCFAGADRGSKKLVFYFCEEETKESRLFLELICLVFSCENFSSNK